MTDYCMTDFCIWRTISCIPVRCISSIRHMYTTDFAYEGPIFLVPLSLSYPSSPVLQKVPWTYIFSSIPYTGSCWHLSSLNNVASILDLCWPEEENIILLSHLYIVMSMTMYDGKNMLSLSKCDNNTNYQVISKTNKHNSYIQILIIKLEIVISVINS